MKLECINLNLSEDVEEPLTFTRDETIYALLGFNLVTGEASIEYGEDGIGSLPLPDAEVEAPYEEIPHRYHAHLGHGT